MKKLLNILSVIILFIGLTGFSGSLTQPLGAASIASSSLSAPSLSAETAQFLPVQQAFNARVTIENQRLIFNWNIAEGYYLYQKGFKFYSKTSSTQLGEPVFAGGILKWDEYFETEVKVFYGQTRFEVPFASEASLFEIDLESQGCADAGLCYPPYQQTIKVNLDSNQAIISKTISQPASISPKDTVTSSPLWLILVLALIGGLILNLMPCVFPILSIKVLSFTQQHPSPREKQRHALAYTLGVVSSFIAIAAVMLALRAGGEAIGWGFQLQSPSFVIFLVFLFTLLGLSLSGYVQLFTGLMSVGQSSETNAGLSSSFMTGVLATTVASPCTAPFMGPALGFAISQTNAVALLIFAFLGLGMALPFVLLTLLPALTAKLPKPGQWMDNLKQFLAFPMYLTAIWLLWVTGRQTSIEVVISVCLGVVLMIMAIWLWQLSQKGKPSVFGKLIKLVAAVLFASAVISPSLKIDSPTEVAQWQNYSAKYLQKLRQEERSVFINLSADWCITCLVNERIAMGKNFYNALEANNIVYLKGDWTNKDPEITQILNQYNRTGVPLYLLFPKGPGDAQILPQLLTSDSLIDYLNSINSI